MEQLLLWAKYHFLTTKKQFFHKHGFLGNFGQYSYNKYIASRPKKRGLGLLERKEIELRNFWCVISGIEGPQKAAGTKKKYTFM